MGCWGSEGWISGRLGPTFFKLFQRKTLVTERVRLDLVIGNSYRGVGEDTGFRKGGGGLTVNY